MEKQFYHIRELSALTGLSVLALKGRRKRGGLVAINIGNEILVPTAEVERFLKYLKSQLP